MPSAWTKDVLTFWFAEIQPAQWFVKDIDLDRLITSRFGATYEALVAGFDLETALITADDALARAIVLDQFPRNMFRGSARAFESDAKALAMAKAAVDRGLDLLIDSSRRLFVYLPFEHSELPGDQRRSVELIGALGDEKLLGYAQAHLAIIERFGRFPHRNAALGRISTAEEMTFLAMPGSGF